MAFVGKIFNNSPSGKKFKTLRENGLKLAFENGHTMESTPERVNTKTENSYRWKCGKCRMTYDLNFLKGENIGSALIMKCPGKPWL